MPNEWKERRSAHIKLFSMGALATMVLHPLKTKTYKSLARLSTGIQGSHIAGPHGDTPCTLHSNSVYGMNI